MRKIAEIHPTVVMVRNEGVTPGDDYRRVEIDWDETMKLAIPELTKMGWEIIEDLPATMPVGGPLIVEVQKIDR